MQKRGLAALIVSIIALAMVGAAPSGAATNASAVTRTFSFIGQKNSKTTTLVNIDSLLINARCSANGSPVIFGFSSATNADLFGRIFDGLGRIHIIRASTFTNKNKGVALSPSSGDYDSTGTVLFETSNGKVVTVNYAFDNSTTLNKMNVCTVYGSFIAT
jgi:Flp pilus assembly pilin Flp